MSFRSDILSSLAEIDDIVAELDLVPVKIERIVRRWSGGERGRGNPGDETLCLPRSVGAREVTTREIASSGGRFEMGDVKLGPVRPYFAEECCDTVGAPGGFTKEQLDPRAEDESEEVLYRLTRVHSMGTGMAGSYRLIHLQSDDPLEWTLYVRRRTDPSDSPEVPELPGD